MNLLSPVTFPLWETQPPFTFQTAEVTKLASSFKRKSKMRNFVGLANLFKFCRSISPPASSASSKCP
ncbi:hypothetical protein PITC_031250 [Penicillium italicum]|uniref:Uncharacterized protein n=1 Tax=Penicillium italicum TaxID=40296 RepID=A0A0A2L2P4_PENIT|nr:hypothetical protein PITC_031250 [Penicillium italicum]